MQKFKHHFFRFSPIITSMFYGFLFAYFISSSTGEEIYGLLYSSPLGAGPSFFLIFLFLGMMVQTFSEIRTHLQHKTPRKRSNREEELNQENLQLKREITELKSELSRNVPRAM